MEYIIKIIKMFILFVYSLFPSSAEISNINLQDGFKINIYAENLRGARFMALSSDGVPFVVSRSTGRLAALPDIDKNGTADEIIFKTSNLTNANSIAFYKRWIYVAEVNQVARFEYNGFDKPLGTKEVIIPGLPYQGHNTKTIIFGRDDKLYLSIGSSCNVCIEKDKRRGAIMQFDPDGTGGKLYAQGLRNSVGMTINPFTGELWASDNGRDWLGDNLPHEEINIIKDGKHYGWPYCYDHQIPDPDYGKPEFCKQTEVPAFKMPAHSAPLGLTFYSYNQFPSRYKGDLFVAFHGSWNRSEPTGYKVVRIMIKNNRPVSIEDFAWGWLKDRNKSGRPVDILVNNDGDMLISDDYGGKIYRIYYDS